MLEEDVRSIVESHPLPDEMPQVINSVPGVELSWLEYQKLKKFWAGFRGSVKDRDCFMVAMPLNEDPDGVFPATLFACVRFSAGKVVVEVLRDLPFDLLESKTPLKISND